jgi:hypothetical protein
VAAEHQPAPASAEPKTSPDVAPKYSSSAGPSAAAKLGDHMGKLEFEEDASSRLESI